MTSPPECKSTLCEKVKSITAEQLGVPQGDIKDSSSFVEDLGADSLDLVELTMASGRQKVPRNGLVKIKLFSFK